MNVQCPAINGTTLLPPPWLGKLSSGNDMAGTLEFTAATTICTRLGQSDLLGGGGGESGGGSNPHWCFICSQCLLREGEIFSSVVQPLYGTNAPHWKLNGEHTCTLQHENRNEAG